MARKLLLLLCMCVVTQTTFADDPLVSKTFPASAKCRRTRQQRMYERSAASSENYRACYDYDIINDDCVVMNPVVDDISPHFVIDNTTVFLIETPQLATKLYPNSLVCFFIIGRRKNGFIYQYFDASLFNQDLEGLLHISDNGVMAEVLSGECQDFFEFREKQFDNEIPINELVTCGNITDPRIQFEVDVASALTLVFKSDEQNAFEGVTLYIIEFDPSLYNSKRKKREIEASPGLPGTIGETGRQGAPGDRGKAGKPGRDGSKGAKGEKGIPGVIGPEGDIGLPGENGIHGDIGPTGPKGKSCTCPSFANCIPGKPGKKGTKGSRGFRGDVGSRGFRGQPGNFGFTGLPGQKGQKGNKGPNGAKGLPGPRGDQGLPGIRGRTGPPGPPGLGGCPLPSDNELSRRIRKVGHIFTTTTELYNRFGLENQMSADEFYDYIMKKLTIEKDTVSDHLYNDESRVARSTESSTDCNGIPVLPGPVGDQGVAGLPGDDGVKGEPGLPGIDGTRGNAGEPGIPGSPGRKGSRGDKGPRGPKGEEGNVGPRGSSGYCQCYQEEKEVGRITFSQNKNGNGRPGRPGPRGPRGPRGPPGSIGETGSPGTPGRRGPKGLKGVKGVLGRTGSNGNPGDKGQLGQQGVQGPTGPPGPPGPPGCVCNNLMIMLDKYGFVRRNIKVPELNIFKPDPKILTNIKSDPTLPNPGDNLNGRTREGNVSTEFSFTLPTPGDDLSGRTKEEDVSTEFSFKPNVTCIRNDSGAAIIGPKGERGLPGFPGATGNPGIPGLPGIDGIPGIKGRRGDPGLPGNNGEKGLQGVMGRKGVTGLDGKQGPPGNNTECILGKESESLIAIECPRGCPNGLDGAVGDKGDTGPKGSSGLKGLRGLRGPPGPRGIAGSSGSPGDEGSVGMPGVKGPPGLRGLPGAIGPAGPAGPPGPHDSCPEYDGVDFDMFLSASNKDIEMMNYLINTPNSKVPTNMTEVEFPLLREVAKLIAGGYRFTNPRQKYCPPLETPVNGKIVFSKNGTRARFNCKRGFSLKGENSILDCLNGKWSSRPPVCSK